MFDTYDQNVWDCEKCEAINNELVITSISFLFLKSINLANYPNFLLEYEIFNEGDNQTSFGVANEDIFIFGLTQDFGNSMIKKDENVIKDLEYNVFSRTNTWQKSSIAGTPNHLIVSINETSWSTQRKKYARQLFRIHQWNSKPVKIRNVTIYSFKTLTCNKNSTTRIPTNLFIMLIIS